MTSKQTDSTRASDSSATLSRTDRTQKDNSDSSGWKRRGFLSTASGVAVTGLFAGCISGGSGKNAKAADDSEGSSVDDWLSDTDNYDGSITDLTGKNSVTVEVGPENNEYVFAPAAIRINPGTTVTWKWIGSGRHNVVAKNDQFKSGEPEPKATYKHTFEAAGTTLYYCAPHKSMGMKGAVVVAGGDTTSAGNTSTQSQAQ